MEVIRSPETLVYNKPTRCHIPEASILYYQYDYLQCEIKNNYVTLIWSTPQPPCTQCKLTVRKLLDPITTVINGHNHTIASWCYPHIWFLCHITNTDDATLSHNWLLTGWWFDSGNSVPQADETWTPTAINGQPLCLLGFLGCQHTPLYCSSNGSNSVNVATCAC
jgi:hypothetical protein